MEGHNWAWEVPQFLYDWNVKSQLRTCLCHKNKLQPELSIEILNIEHNYDAYHGWPYLDATILK